MNTDMIRSHGYDPRGPGADRRYGNIPETAARVRGPSLWLATDATLTSSAPRRRPCCARGRN